MFAGWNTEAFIMACIAGLSTGLGGILVLINGSPSATKLGHLLSFSSGVMLYISFMDLLPEASESLGFLKANGAFFVGMLSFALLSKFIPEDFGHDHSKDEHQHTSKDTTNKKKSEKSKKNSTSELKRVGLVTALGISIHNFPEGIAVYLACMRGLEVGLPIALAIGAHNIPEGMAVASPIYHSTGSKWEAFKYSMLSGICEPIAALIFAMFFSSSMTQEHVHLCLAAVAGIMVLVSLKELLPTSLKYISAESSMISNALGMIFIGLSIYFLHSTDGHGHSHNHGEHHSHSHTHSHSHGHSHNHVH